MNTVNQDLHLRVLLAKYNIIVNLFIACDKSGKKVIQNASAREHECTRTRVHENMSARENECILENKSAREHECTRQPFVNRLS